MDTTPTRAPRTCRVCSGAMRGRSHEHCRLQQDAQWFQFRSRRVDEDSNSDAKSECSSSTESSHSMGLNTPPPSPTSSLASIRGSVASSSGTSSSEKSVRRQLAPTPPVYPRIILSEPSFEIPETGPFHRVNPNYRAPQVPTAPPSEAGSDVSTEVDFKFYPIDRPPSPGPSARGFMARESTPGSDSGVTSTAGRTAREGPDAPAPTNATLVRHTPFNLEAPQYDYFAVPPVPTKYEAIVAILEPTRTRVSALVDPLFKAKSVEVIMILGAFYFFPIMAKYASKKLEL